MTKSSLEKRRTPRRTCIVCRQVSGKRELFRLVYTEVGLQVDKTGKLPGRGAYVCSKPECWFKAAQGDLASKALKTSFSELDRALLSAHGAQIASISMKPQK